MLWPVLISWFVSGWQVKLCDSLVTHAPCLTSIIALRHDSLLGLSLLFCMAVCSLIGLS